MSLRICKLVATVLMLSVSMNATAQLKRPHILIGGNISYANPKASFSEGYNFGIGGELTGGVGFNKTFLLATLGSSLFFANNKNVSGNLTVAPVKVGVKQYFLARKVFVQGDIGMASLKDKTMKAENHFTRGIGAGVRFLGLEGGLFYDGWKSLHAGGFSNSVLVKVGWSKIL